MRVMSIFDDGDASNMLWGIEPRIFFGIECSDSLLFAQLYSCIDVSIDTRILNAHLINLAYAVLE